MARVTIVLEDINGGVQVTVSSDPPFTPKDEGKDSPAQQMAMKMKYKYFHAAVLEDDDEDY